MLRIATAIIFVILAYASLFSIMNIMAPRFMMSEAIESLLGISPDKNKQVEAMKALEFGQRIMGAIGLVIAICGFIILFLGFWKARKWAWWTLLVAGFISCIWSLIYPLWGLIFHGLAMAFRSNVFYQTIVFGIFLIGLSIPINSFFKKEQDRSTEEFRDSQSKEKDL